MQQMQWQVNNQGAHTLAELTTRTAAPVVAVVDDDPLYLELIGRSLVERGMQCLLAVNSTGLLDQVDPERPPDVFLLDYHLGTPRETGLSLCRSVRLRYGRPVVMLTGDDKTQTIVSCLEAGAEQYLIKPCSIDELVARLRVVLRERQTALNGSGTGALSLQTAGSRSLTLANLRLETGDRSLHNVTDGTRHCDLTEKESQLMQLFMQSPDQTLSRADSFFALYQYEMDPENRSVDVLVTKLRKKIARVDTDARIQTLRGCGYRLIVGASQADNQSGTAMTDKQDEARDAEPILDAQQLSRTLESTDPALQIEFYEVFLQHVNAEMENWSAARDNPDTLRAMAHQLKSSSQSIGTPRFTRALINIEAIARSADADASRLTDAMQTVSHVWCETADAIEHRIRVLTVS